MAIRSSTQDDGRRIEPGASAVPTALDQTTDLGLPEAETLPPGPSYLTAVDRWLARALLRAAGQPAIQLRLWDGTTVTPDPVEAGRVPSAGCLHIRDRTTFWKLIADPQFQFGEAYSNGRVEVLGDLETFLCELFRCTLAIAPSLRSRFESLWRSRLGNSLSAARRNVSRHYDLGNDFYRLWLDEQLVYTCAYFSRPDLSLEAAQVAKFDHICRKLRLQPGDQVIEAGCGWGAFALHMARRYGVTVRAFNLSREQMQQARRSARTEGLANQVEFIEDDWRNISGRCDAFVSVGMLEHVGPPNYDQCGGVIGRCLKPHGRGLIHTIGVVRARPLDRWTERRIFPGAQPPAMSEILRILEPQGLAVLDAENLRLHYATTIRHWRERFEQSAETVLAMFDERFVRMWRLYLNASIASFHTGSLQLFQVLFAREANNDLPATRGDLYRDEIPHG